MYPWRASRRLLHSRVPTNRPTILNRDTDSSAYSPLSPDVRTYFWLASDTHILDFTAMRDAFLLTLEDFVAKLHPDLNGWSERDNFRTFYFNLLHSPGCWASFVNITVFKKLLQAQTMREGELMGWRRAGSVSEGNDEWREGQWMSSDPKQILSPFSYLSH